MRAIQVTVGIGTGGVVTPPAAILAIVSGGAGHGHYEFARLLFPFTMLLTRVTEDKITIPLIVLALAQFPLYGASIGICAARPWLAFVIGGVLFIGHLIAAAFCFSGVIPNFS
jgi:hypothetical protein